MARLPHEFQRLYRLDPSAPQTPVEGVRVLVLEVTGTTPWQALSAVWQGVQAELELPAPAIAVNGRDALALWFSLAQAVPAAEGLGFLHALQRYYLAELPARRVRLLAGLQDEAAGDEYATTRAAAVPALQVEDDRWSAFIASDLAPVFDDTPWLDVPPGDEGQAERLARLKSITPTQWQQAHQQLRVAADAAVSVAQPGPDAGAVPVAASAAGASLVGAADLLPAAPASAATAAHTEAQRFLEAVLRDPSAPLALRVQAAQTLLPHRPLT